VLPDGTVVIEGRFDPGVALNGRVLAEAHIGDAPAVVALFGLQCGATPHMKWCV
jgi:hypothetical protein